MEARARIMVIGLFVGGLMLGAAYLYAVRGEAMILDLAAMGRALLCL